MTEKTTLLVTIALSEAHRAQVAERYDTVYAPTAAERAAAIAAHGTRIRAVLTNGTVGFTAAEIDALPVLELVCAMGAGHENIDAAAARARGIALANGAGTNDDCVADHAFGLLIAAVRGIVRLDQYTRAGGWRDGLAFPPNVSGKRLGIVGLGTIGRKIGRRAEGFDMPVGYHNRRAVEGSAYTYFDSVRALAEWADFLVVATPGGPATRHLVNAEVLAALGPRGVLVNIARGSVVDTAALAAALKAGTIAGAGLDVYESEPHPPASLVEQDNLVITPHVAGWSPEAVQQSIDQFLQNADGHFAGRGVVAPI